VFQLNIFIKNVKLALIPPKNYFTFLKYDLRIKFHMNIWLVVLPIVQHQLKLTHLKKLEYFQLN